MSLWKEPEPKRWYSFVVDGKCIATVEECAAVEKEMKRLSGLAGVQIGLATDEQLIHAKALTRLPKRITDKMEMAAAQKRS
ncbi:MAG: hypothetical protein KKI15_02730 [Proteobacteria bacterium]|nr:hypothetical protein [Pseudomonadota bacterium]